MGDGALDETKRGTFLLGGFSLVVLRPHGLRRVIEGGKQSATMLRFGLLQSDRECGFYHVEAVTQAFQGLHEHASPVIAYSQSLRGH